MGTMTDDKTICIRHKCGHVYRYHAPIAGDESGLKERLLLWSEFADLAPVTTCPHCASINPAYGGMPTEATARRFADVAIRRTIPQCEAHRAVDQLERMGIDAGFGWHRWLYSDSAGWFYEADPKLAGADTLGYAWMVSDDGPEDDRWVDLTVVVVDEREDDENETEIAWAAKIFRVGTQHDPLELILRRAEFIRAKWVANQDSDEVRGWVAEAEAEAADQRKRNVDRDG